MSNNETIILFPNTTAIERYHSQTGAFIGWRVTPDPGYVLHHTSHDMPVFDDDGNLTDEVIPGYTRTFITVGYNYDFETNPFEIYAVLESEIPDPDNQIHGDDGNDHVTA